MTRHRANFIAALPGYTAAVAYLLIPWLAEIPGKYLLHFKYGGKVDLQENKIFYCSLPSVFSHKAWCVSWRFLKSANALFDSVQFSRSVVSDSLWSQGLQHTRLPCPSSTPGAYSNSCPSIDLVMASNYLILCRPLLLLPSSIGVFYNETVLHIR